MPLQRRRGWTSLIDVLDRVLDKGIVIDAWVRATHVVIDLVKGHGRVTVYSLNVSETRTPQPSRKPFKSR